jgi:hypothetical protein
MSASAVGLAICLAGPRELVHEVSDWAALARGQDRLRAESVQPPDLSRADKTILLFSGVDVFLAETEPHDSAQ